MAPDTSSSHPVDISKSDLLRLRNREADTVERWFRDHVDALYNFVYYRVRGDADIAADVVQDTILHALRVIDRYDPTRGTMHTWLTFLSRNHIKRARRYLERRQTGAVEWHQLDRDLVALYRTIALEPLPGECLDRDELTALVQMTLSSIPTNYRHALTQRYYKDHGPREIGESMAISEGAAKSLLHRARQAFRTAFVAFAESAEFPRRPRSAPSPTHELMEAVQ